MDIYIYIIYIKTNNNITLKILVNKNKKYCILYFNFLYTLSSIPYTLYPILYPLFQYIEN